MSFFKTSVSIPMFTVRLSKLFDSGSRSFRESTYQIDRSTPAGKKFGEAVAGHIDGLVAFAMQFSIKTYLRPHEAEVALRSFTLHTALTSAGEDEYYWKRFGDIPDNRSAFARPQIEYIMAGNAFLELCGKTEIKQLDDLIRQYGADIFVKVCEVTKKEIKSVRLNA